MINRQSQYENLLKHLYITRTQQGTLSDRHEYEYACQLEEIWNDLTENERAYIERLTDKLKRLNIVISILNACDPECLIKMGAPNNEYTSEAESILEAIDNGEKINAELIRSVWAKWFGTGSRPNGEKVTWVVPMRNSFQEVAERLRNTL
jgi:hypothetical protein